MGRKNDFFFEMEGVHHFPVTNRDLFGLYSADSCSSTSSLHIRALQQFNGVIKVLLETYTQLAGMIAQCRQYHFHSLILNVKFNYFGLVSYNRSRVLDLLFLVRSRHFESSQGSRGAVFQISETFLKCPANR